MKLGLISDLHCNVANLAVALEKLDGCDEVLCAGDLMYQYRLEPEILQRLRQRGARAIVGNHDLDASRTFKGRGGALGAAAEELFALPRRLDLTFGDARVLVCHGSPWDRPDEDVFLPVHSGDLREIGRIGQLDYDLVVLGHTHVPFSVPAGRGLVINPGACGEPGREPGRLERVSSCCSVDLETREVTFHQFAGRH